MPVLELENLEICNFGRNCLEAVDGVNLWRTPKLRILDLKVNKIKVMSALVDLSIQTLDISQNCFEDLGKFSTDSRLPLLRKLVVNNVKQLKRIGGNFSGCPRIE